MPGKALPALTVVTGEYATASAIMTEASHWLLERGEPLWMPDEVTEGALRKRCPPESVLVGIAGGEPVAAALLEWRDERCWPGVVDAGFIHRLAVRRAWAGQGYAEALLANAAGRTAAAGRTSMRLDCLADRHRLCAFYERCGFERTGSMDLGPYRLALYSRSVT
jgi:GNAT superfamily N-acetyltransferase